MLNAIAFGNLDETAPDFVAFQRLISFGFIVASSDGNATITKEGREALRMSAPQ